MTTLTMKEKKQLDEIQRVYCSELTMGYSESVEGSARMIIAVIFYR